MEEKHDYETILDRAIERECAEWVFGLTGGELNDGAWYGYWWYDEVPEWCGDFDHHSDEFSYRTILRLGPYATPDEIDTQWIKVAAYTNSGETECPLQQADEYNRETYQGPATCLLCRGLVMASSHHYDPCEGVDWDEHNAKPHSYPWLCADLAAFDEWRGHTRERSNPFGHGYVYLGDGCAEVIYRCENEPDDFDDGPYDEDPDYDLSDEDNQHA